MNLSPYRRPHGGRSKRCAECDRELIPVLVVFWIASVARFLYAMLSGEAFGVEATLATLSAALVPALVFWPGERADAEGVGAALQSKL